MAWQCIVGIIIMVISFVGVLVAAKSHREPIAMLCAVVMLVGLGMYAWYYFNPPPNLDYQVYGKAVATKVGAAAKAAGVQKAIYVTSDTQNEYAKMCIEAFKNGFGGSVETVALMDGNMGGMMELTPAKLREILKSATADDAVILDVSMMMPVGKIEFVRANYKGPKVFLTNNANLMGASSKVIATAFNKGGLAGVVIGLTQIDEDFSPDEDELEEAFNKRYILVNKDNFDSNKDRFGMN